MNSEQAKQISLPDLLEQLGHIPVKTAKAGRELWYRSPFRDEKEPSFHTSFLGGKWIWNDFGDIGGTVIDFVMRYEGLTSVKDALSYLDDKFPHSFPLFDSPKRESTNFFSFQQQHGREAASNFSENRKLEFISAKPLTNSLILSYLTRERHLSEVLAKVYLREVKYRNLDTGKEYFAFGMENQSGGYEIRVASDKYSFKSALKARDITVIAGKNPDDKTVNIFEGMTDFLSFLVMMNASNLSGDTVIMHSLSSFGKAAEHIRKQDYKTIKTYLDNNKPGQECTERFCEEFGVLVVPQSEVFAPYTDLNDALRAHSKSTTSRRQNSRG